MGWVGTVTTFYIVLFLWERTPNSQHLTSLLCSLGCLPRYWHLRKQSSFQPCTSFPHETQTSPVNSVFNQETPIEWMVATQPSPQTSPKNITLTDVSPASWNSSQDTTGYSKISRSLFPALCQTAFQEILLLVYTRMRHKVNLAPQNSNFETSFVFLNELALQIWQR